MIVPLTISFLFGKTEKVYESQPLTKEWINGTWERELLIGTTLVGLVVGHITAIITNGAQNYVLLCVPCFLVTGGTHWLSIADKEGAKVNFVTGHIIFCLTFTDTSYTASNSSNVLDSHLNSLRWLRD